MNDTNRPNRLIDEKSPYLLQHAHNPVDWYPWGDEALQRARSENKPILLSIGYSTCHWCNVMEDESFMDPSIAQLMNDNFCFQWLYLLFRLLVLHYVNSTIPSITTIREDRTLREFAKRLYFLLPSFLWFREE